MNMLVRRMRGEERVRDGLTVLFVSVSLIVVLLYCRWPAAKFWLPVALAGIALAIWHGAYDTVLAENLWEPRLAGRWMLPFVTGYVGLAAAVMVAWYGLPTVALAAFLGYSALHFGSETERGRGLLAWTSACAFGALPIAAACNWHTAAVLPIFIAMARGNDNAVGAIVSIAGTSLAFCIVLASVPVWRRDGAGVRRAALIGAQLLLFRFCPPVLAFAVFFCVLHTPEHLIETSRNANQRFSFRLLWRNLRAGVMPWLLSLAAIAVATWIGRQTVQDYTATLFVALSALTVPHMVLAMLPTTGTFRKQTLLSRPVRRPVHP